MSKNNAFNDVQSGQSGYLAPSIPGFGGSGSASGDVGYNQQIMQLEGVRRDADDQAAYAKRQQLRNRLDELQSMGLDAATLADAASIDDALHASEKAAQQVLDAADAAIAGLRKRHGGIKEAVDDSPVDKIAKPEFYQD